MPRITRNSARLANANNNNGSTTASTTTASLAPTSTTSVRTRSRVATANNNDDSEEAPIVIRRSTRRAALDAKARIAEESKREFERKRKSRRIADSAAINSAQQLSSLDNALDLKPAARSSKQVAVLFKSEESEEEDVSQLKDFTCAICLDKPDTLVDLATIAGCSHKFCFDCIDKWAETENKCPCCKSRFNRIDRVKKLPPATPPPTTTTSRRGKRKRSDNTNNSGSNTRRRTGDNESTAGGAASSSSAAAPRVNSRTVEDRNQQHLPAGLSFAMLEQIFSSAFMGGGFGLSTGERGRTTIRFPVPASMAGEDSDLDDMAGMLRMILQDATIGGPSARFTVQVRRTNGPPAAGEAGEDAPDVAAERAIVDRVVARASASRARASGGGVARASGGAAAASSRSSSGSSPRRGRSSPRASSSGESRASRQRSSLFSYFSRSPSSRRSRSSASGAARSSSASRPASRSDSGVIDLANSDSEDMPGLDTL